MYCVKCGVKLADTEKKCPLCNTVVYHPDVKQPNEEPLYPSKKMPKSASISKILNGAVIITFVIALVVCYFADLLLDDVINWFGYVVGALVVAYVAFALPLWFKKPNPVIFTPCAFAAVILYLFYIDFMTGGNWFLTFAFPITGGLCVIISATITLLYYVRKGKLYIFGGMFMALGALMTLIEFLLEITFNIEFIGWSIYPFGVLFLFGGLLIYFAINKVAREMIERKLFF